MDNSTAIDSTSTSNTDNTTITSNDNSGGVVEGYDPTAAKPQRHQDLLIALICVFMFLSLILITLRTFIKFRRLKRLRSDDYTLLASAIFIILLILSQLEDVHYGAGLHAWNSPDSTFNIYYQWSIGYVAYYPTVSLIKITVCLCYIQIMAQPANRKIRIFTYGLSAVIGIMGVLTTFLYVFACSPVKSVNIGTDLILCILPFFSMAESSLEPGVKRILIVMFMSTLLGTAACAVGVWAIWYIQSGDANADITYDIFPYILCNDAEIFAYTIGVFLPILSPNLITLHRQLTSKSRSNDGSNSGTNEPKEVKSSRNCDPTTKLARNSGV